MAADVPGSRFAAGGAVAVGVFSRVMVWLLEQGHDPTYGFFSGLSLASIWMPVKMIRRFGAVEGLSAVVGLGLVLEMIAAEELQYRMHAGDVVLKN